MCGLLGEFGKIISPKKEFTDILEFSRQRGLDMTGYYNNQQEKPDQIPSVQFGFNRLAILDLRKDANQPVISKSKRFVVMCNGEITNYLKLKKEMCLKEKDLRSSSDTEILCYALDYYGLRETLDRINGMYALVIYDLQNHNIYLIRDPAGIKPLYFARTKLGWIFASQYDQIFKHLWFKNEIKINPEALTDFLRLGYIPAPSALFEKSWMLQPGSFLTINSDLNSYLEHYHILDGKGELHETDESTLDKLSNVLNNTFPDYVHSDVPLGSFLSGGVDSPIVNAILSKTCKSLKAFTISTNHLGFDEAIQAEKISKHLGIDHHVKTLKGDRIKSIIDDHFSAFSEPFSDYSSIPTYILCSEASKHYKVLLSGDGGDELFWGYPRFLSVMDYQNWFQYPKALRLIWASLLRRFGMQISSCIELNSIEEWVFERQSPIWVSQVKKIMPDAKHSFTTKQLYSIPDSINNSKKLLNWLRNNEFYGHLQRVLLKVDRASMAHNIEVRVPFLDKRVIDFSSSINPELGLTHRNTKYLLKNILNRYIPENYYLDHKQGFSFDLTKLLNNELREDFQDTLMSKDLFGFEFIDSDIIYDMVNNYYGGKGITNEWGMWTLYSLQKWANLVYNK